MPRSLRRAEFLLLAVGRPLDAYNIVFNAAIGIAHNVLWMVWSVSSSVAPSSALAKLLPAPYPPPTTISTHAMRPSPQAQKQTHTWLPALVGVLFSLAMCFELFDFAPVWRTVDAHALWHLATVGIVPLWWRFLEADAVRLDASDGRA